MQTSTFDWLVVGHLVGDFLLQTGWMAANKERNGWALLAHSLVYTAAVAAFSIRGGGLSLAAVTLIFFSHVVLDQRRFTSAWSRILNGPDAPIWFRIVLDQCWHILVLLLATQI